MSVAVQVSAVICAHNPRPNYLERVLRSLREQTLHQDAWELLLVDNASGEPVSASCDLNWHSKSRHIAEPMLGLTPARIRGILESSGELIVFVDDDNVLAPDYLGTALAIACEHPWLGAWGGQAFGEFETEPPPWSRTHLECLALRDVPQDQWSNSVTHYDSAPNGAGLCVRTSVAHAWAKKLRNDPARFNLGRKGSNHSSSEDTDLALTACDLGLGTGIFTRLRLTHLIPKERLTLPYFERLMEGVAASHVILENARRPIRERPRPSFVQRLFWRYQLCRMAGPERRLQIAMTRGRDAAYRALGL
jgi:glycosyltransferase involved in cell wall biosynthesis